MNQLPTHHRASRALTTSLALAVTLGVCLSVSGTSGASASTSPRTAGPMAVAKLVQQSKTESALLIYGNAPSQYLQPVLTAFTKQYPWIHTQDSDLTDNQVFSKFEAEHAQGAQSADLLISSDAALWVQAEHNGLIDPVTPTGLANFPPESNQGHGVYVMSDEPVITVYSPKLLTPAEVPTSYAQLAQDVRKDPAKYNLNTVSVVSNGLAYTAVYGLLHILGAKKTWNYFDAYGPHSTVFADSLGGLQQLTQGGASIGYIGSGLAQGVIPQFKGLAKYEFMSDATPLIPRGIAVTHGASDPASAQLFLDYVFSKAGQDALCQAGFEATMKGFSPVNGCTASLTSLASQVPPNTTYTVPFVQDVVNQQAAITKRWNQAFHR
jgi:iron(III) transport system substrate-binding protein